MGRSDRLRSTAAAEPADRRAALKRLAAAGVIASAGHWARPVIDTVVLPAHAQATGFVLPASFTGTPALTLTIV